MDVDHVQRNIRPKGNKGETKEKGNMAGNLTARETRCDHVRWTSIGCESSTLNQNNFIQKKNFQTSFSINRENVL